MKSSRTMATVSSLVSALLFSAILSLTCERACENLFSQ